jgi:simple sugar transport system permease protein
MSDTLDLLLGAPFWIAVLRIATPLLLGTLGVLLCERAGVLNPGIEGILGAGAFAGWLAVYHGGGLWAGVAVAAGIGIAFGALHAALTVGLSLSHHVSGLGITLLATSLASYAYRVSFPKVDSPPTIQPFAEMSWLPLPVLNAQTPLTLLALLLVPALAWLLYRTPLGLALRTVGENPDAVESQGLSVAWLRSGAVMAGSGLMGVAGAFLTLPPSTRSTSTWSTAAAGSASRSWCLRRGGRGARSAARCCSASSTRCSCGCSKPAPACSACRCRTSSI